MPQLDPQLIAIAVVGSIVTLVGSAVLLPVVVARMPADYFVSRTGGAFAEAHPVLRYGYRALKNLLGVVLLLAGVALSLLDFPGKRAVELRIVRIGRIQRAITWLRERVGRPPLELPPERDQLQEEGGA